MAIRKKTSIEETDGKARKYRHKVVEERPVYREKKRWYIILTSITRLHISTLTAKKCLT